MLAEFCKMFIDDEMKVPANSTYDAIDPSVYQKPNPLQAAAISGPEKIPLTTQIHIFAVAYFFSSLSPIIPPKMFEVIPATPSITAFATAY